MLLPLLILPALAHAAPVTADTPTPGAASMTQERFKDLTARMRVLAIIGTQAVVSVPSQQSADAIPMKLTVKHKEAFLLAGRQLYPLVENSTLSVFLVSGRGEVGEAVYSGTVATQSAMSHGVAAGSGAWVVMPGASLKETLHGWTAQAGWVLVWELGERDDFTTGAGDTYAVDFKAAVRALFDALPARIRIRAVLHPDNEPPLLYVTRDEGGR
ncbi:MAG: TcpQ domain-containing protein [Proteobacteria bacterium]|nr:TcpQ domain-containing protein [Pseudomonadota bacterium]